MALAMRGQAMLLSLSLPLFNPNEKHCSTSGQYQYVIVYGTSQYTVILTVSIPVVNGKRV